VVKAIVVAILLASVAMMALVTFAGWSKLEGLTPLNLMWCRALLGARRLQASFDRLRDDRLRAGLECRDGGADEESKRCGSPPVVPPAQASAD